MAHVYTNLFNSTMPRVCTVTIIIIIIIWCELSVRRDLKVTNTTTDVRCCPLLLLLSDRIQGMCNTRITRGVHAVHSRAYRVRRGCKRGEIAKLGVCAFSTGRRVTFCKRRLRPYWRPIFAQSFSKIDRVYFA